MTKILLLCVIVLQLCDSKLILLTVIHRHGDRTPIKFYPTDPHQNDYWPRGFGQLTNQGKMQEYELGKFMRRRYKEFIGERYFSNLTYYRSTNFDRTLMSAQLVAAGLFRPTSDDVWNSTLSWQPVPIHTVAPENDLLLAAGSCPVAGQLGENYLKSPTFHERKEKYAQFFEKLSKHVGYDLNITNFGRVYDDVLIELKHNMSEPDWIMDAWNRIKQLAGYKFGIIAATSQLKRLRGGPFVKEFINHARLKIAKKISQVVFLYSGHDSTLSIILSTLDIYNGIQPPFASAIFFELHCVNDFCNIDSDYGVKILYRNNSKVDPYPITLPGCNRIICPLEKFLKIVHNIIPDDIEKECGLDAENVSAISNGSAEYLILTIILGFIIFDIIGCVILWTVMKFRRNIHNFQSLVNTD
ncbi:Uncharacterised protein r2_g2512 [Pycnogonum litorale]